MESQDLRNAGLKVTHPRIRVLEILEHSHDHLTAENIYKLRQHHDHMIDVTTGKVVEFVNEEIEKLQHEIAAKHGFEIVDHSLVLYVRPKKKKA